MMWTVFQKSKAGSPAIRGRISCETLHGGHGFAGQLHHLRGWTGKTAGYGFARLQEGEFGAPWACGPDIIGVDPMPGKGIGRAVISEIERQMESGRSAS